MARLVNPPAWQWPDIDEKLVKSLPDLARYLNKNIGKFSSSYARTIESVSRIQDKMDEYDPRDFGWRGGSRDETESWQATFDALGDTSTMRAGKVVGPDAPSNISGTLTIDKKAIWFTGVGPGKSGTVDPTVRGGTTFVWQGPAGLPMILLRRSWFTLVENLRFVGHILNPPLCSIELNYTAGDSPPDTLMGFSRIWVGHYSGFDVAGTILDNGIITSGGNVQVDQSWMEMIYVTDLTPGVGGSGVRLLNSQNTLWDIRHLVTNCGQTAKGITCGTRHVELHTPFFQGNGVDINIIGDGTIDVYNMGSELSGRLIEALGGCSVRIKGGYWQAGPMTNADNNVIDISGGASSLKLTDLSLNEEGYVGTGEKIKMRGPSAVVVLDGTGLFGRTPSAVLDLGGSNGDKRRVELRGADSGNFECEWTLPDTPDYYSRFGRAILLSGEVPATKKEGEVWFDAVSGHFYGRIGGVDKQLDN
jgi:hypothetical protein